MIKEHTHRLFLSVILFPYLSISSLLWTVCPCLYLKIQGISEQEESYAVLSEDNEFPPLGNQVS